MVDKPDCQNYNHCPICRARIAELEAIAREIINAHRDVETGLEVPKYIYKMAVAAIEK